MAKVDDNVFPKVIEAMNTSDPAAPTDASWKVYAKANGIFARSSNSVVGPFGTSGAGTTIATDTIWDAAGDLVQGTGADTAAKLTAGTAGMTLKSAGAAAANLWAFPPGYEIAYTAFTSDVTVSATTEGAANTVVSTSSATYENVPYVISLFSPRVDNGSAATLVMDLYVDSTILGRVAVIVGSSISVPYSGSVRYTPTAAAHTFTWKAWRVTANGFVGGGAGGTGANVAGYIRVTKV